MESEWEPGTLLGDSEASALDLSPGPRVPEQPVRVVQAHEEDPRRRRRRLSEPRDGFRDERVRYVADRAPGNLGRGKKRPVDERQDAPLGAEAFDRLIRLLPHVAVRKLA